MNFVIGVDQGGSGTRAVICSLDGRILGKGWGPGACHAFDGLEAAMQATQNAVRAAYGDAGFTEKAKTYVGGHTGADWSDEYILLREGVEALNLAEKVIIVNDSMVALRAGMERTYGAILVAGTGANCAVRSPDGREFIYHYYHDDELQGGGAIGRAALKAIFRAETGRPPQTVLRQRVLEYFDLPDVDILKRKLVEGRFPVDRIPEIAPLVFEASAKGDVVANKILTHFGKGCAELVVNGLRRMRMLEMEVDVVLAGGIFKNKYPFVVDTMANYFKKHSLQAHLIMARYEPVVGAALLALENEGVVVTAALKENFDRTARELGLELVR